MGSTTIVTGPRRKHKKVESVLIAKGLVAHTPPDEDKTSGLLNITHSRSGFSVVQYVHESHLPDVMGLLGGLNWDVPKEAIYKSKRHFSAVKKVCVLANRKDSQKQEARLAKDLGGRVQPGSGARWGYRRDVVTDVYLVEAKTTDTHKYLISEKDFNYLMKQAYERGKVPLYSIGIRGEPDVIVIPRDELDEEFFDGQAVREVSKRNRKSIPVDYAMSTFVNDGGVINFSTKTRIYTILGYEKFLHEVKKGINE